MGDSLNLEAFTQQAPIRLESNDYLTRQEHLESNARSYPRRIPLALKKAQGIYLQDTTGQLFIDCLAGAGTLVLGHNHPNTVAAMRKVLDSGMPLHTLDLTTPVKDRFINDLFSVLPPELSERARIQFCSPSGADAIEAALKLVKTATGRRGIFAFSGGYHGMTHGALALMGNLGPKRPISGLMPEVHFLPFPYDYRCPFGLGGEQGIDASLNYIRHLLTDPESGVPTPAAIVVEAVQGEGGVIPAPLRWLQGLRELTRERHVPLIIDEVQTGIGRTGRLFAFEHAGILPDVLVLSKAIGGGLPLSVVVYDAELDRWEPGAHAGTFRGNQLAMAAGSATLTTIVREHLATHAQHMGDRLRQQLVALQTHYPALGEVRGLGLMLGVEIVNPHDEPDPRGCFPADSGMAQRIQRHCLNNGVIVELGGRFGSTVRFLPPLIISEQEVDQVARSFASAVEAAHADRRLRDRLVRSVG
ncbi:MAG: diaminobutyrate--2-oxoglutarate transaminase [Nitrococcus mobilis]|nr:diaminobutyrate--2-oxoglutarate transaminase [Nitrococcus mobilis]